MCESRPLLACAQPGCHMVAIPMLFHSPAAFHKPKRQARQVRGQAQGAARTSDESQPEPAQGPLARHGGRKTCVPDTTFSLQPQTPPLAALQVNCLLLESPHPTPRNSLSSRRSSTIAARTCLETPRQSPKKRTKPCREGTRLSIVSLILRALVAARRLHTL